MAHARTPLAALVAASLLAACVCDDEVLDPTRDPPTVQDDTGTLVDPDVADRGQAAGSEADVDSRRNRFDAIDPVEPTNANDLAYAPGTVDDEETQDDLKFERVVPVQWKISPRAGTGRTVWNSAEGRLASEDHVETDYTSNWPLPGREVCVPPELLIDCCSYTLTEGDQDSADTETYYSPEDLFADAASADVALREIYAQVPIYLPFTDADVKLSQGWIYNSGGAHGSHDYNQSAATDEGEDPSFRVRSAGPGTVVAKYWDAWHGNVLVIEHDDAGDLEYRSFYFHLRDGKDHDLAMAKSETVATGNPDSSRDKYLAFANLPDANALWWGTNSQAIPVDVGDHVGAQQMIAWSGNTGPGGAGKGLNQDGTPTNSITANNHLHFMIAVRHPDWTGSEWLFVDPAGVYEEVDTGCYDLVDNTQYDRLLAPFYPYFHGVELGVFNAYLYYYGQMGRSPATFSVQQPGSGAIAAGAFKSGLSSAWYIYDYLPAGDFQDRFDTLVAQDFRLTERSVTLDTSNVPRHNGVFRPDTIFDWYSYGNLTVSDYQDTFDELTADGYDLVDFFGYHEGNTDRVAALFAPQAGGFVHHGLLDSAAFTDVTNQLANDGWLPVDVNVMEMAGGTSLSALYRQTGDARMVHWGMTGAEYQQWTKFYLSDGWDLEVVQSYADGGRYAAIWSH